MIDFATFLKENGINYYVHSHRYPNGSKYRYIIVNPSVETILKIIAIRSVDVISDVGTIRLYYDDYIEYSRFTKGVCSGEYEYIHIHCKDDTVIEVKDIYCIIIIDDF